MATVVPNGRIRQVKQRYGTYALLDDGRVINDAVAGQRTVLLDGQGRNVTPPPSNACHALPSPASTKSTSKTVLLRSVISPDVRLAYFLPFRVRITATNGALRLAAGLGYYENFACQISENFSSATRISLHHLHNPSPYYDEPVLEQWHEQKDRFLTQLPYLRYYYISPVDGGLREAVFQDRPADLAYAQFALSAMPSGILWDQTPFANRTEISTESTCTTLEYFGITYRYVHPYLGEVGRGAAWNNDYSPYTLFNTSGAWRYFQDNSLALGYACVLQPGARLESGVQTTTSLQLRDVVESSANIPSIAAQFPLMTRMVWDFSVTYSDATHAGQIEVTTFTRNSAPKDAFGAFATNRFRWYSGSVTYDGYRDFYGWYDVPMSVFPYQSMFYPVDTPDGTVYVLQNTPYQVECLTLNNMYNPYALTVGGNFPVF